LKDNSVVLTHESPDIHMNKSELIDAVAAQADLPKAVSARAVTALLEIITATLAKKEEVTLVGFGTFKVSQRASRVGRNPRTGTALTIPASSVPKFTVGLALKSAVQAGGRESK
jgi:DNA-binding protein HU-beta